MEKTIKINPEFLHFTKKKKMRKGGLKENSKKLRKKFLEKIKEYQKKREMKGEQLGDNNFKKELGVEQSIDFLKKIQKERKQKQILRRKKQCKTQPESTPKPHKYKTKPDPPYGVLKGGKKPLYRDWKNKTLKKKIEKRRKRVRKLTLGKNSSKRIVSVIIKNKTIKKRIEDKKRKLKNKSTNEIKKFLRRKGLIRIG